MNIYEDPRFIHPHVIPKPYAVILGSQKSNLLNHVVADATRCSQRPSDVKLQKGGRTLKERTRQLQGTTQKKCQIDYYYDIFMQLQCFQCQFSCENSISER